MTMVNEIFNFLDKTNKTISFAESCTGGALSSSLTMIPGASKVFLGSIVSYSTYSKQELLNIDKSDLDKYSPVSERIAITMAENVKKQFKSCLLYTSPSPRDLSTSRMPSSA